MRLVMFLKRLHSDLSCSTEQSIFDWKNYPKVTDIYEYLMFLVFSSCCPEPLWSESSVLDTENTMMDETYSEIALDRAKQDLGRAAGGAVWAGEGGPDPGVWLPAQWGLLSPECSMLTLCVISCSDTLLSVGQREAGMTRCSVLGVCEGKTGLADFSKCLPGWWVSAVWCPGASDVRTYLHKILKEMYTRVENY